MLTWDNIQSNAIAFSKRWKDGCKEVAESQSFITEFLNVFGVDDPVRLGDFEYEVMLTGNRTGYIDYLLKGQIAIEMKSRGKDLTAAFEQLHNYLSHLPEDELPDLWMVCDFENVRLSRRSTNEFYAFKTKDLRKHIKRFANIAGYTTKRVRDIQVEVNIKAAEKMAKLHDLLKIHGYDGHELRVYLVRLLFCLFAHDTGIFPQDSLYEYLEKSDPDGSDLSEMINKLFEILDMPPDVRIKRTLISDELKQFRHINGKLFKDHLPSAEFNEKMRQTLLECLDFDWNRISPAIFGAMFQGVMDAKQRREMGAHYTSEENILKLINPLFLDELWQEFDRVKTDPAALDLFHEKIARLRFLDPACGCGNFLIITYRELRVLELEILKMKTGSNQLMIDITPMLKVGVEQFYGIEYEDFPCQIAQVGMWLVDHQMNIRVSEQFGLYYTRLPLTQSATIVHGNALRLDWEKIVPKNELSYILGNPPFIGSKMMSDEQRDDMAHAIVDDKGNSPKGAGVLDYVAAWYYKSAKHMQGTKIASAFVSTNSITQGEQATSLWKPLFEIFGIKIDFGYRTFKWCNEAKGKAAVHCVIVGFSTGRKVKKTIYDGEERITAYNINPYLVDASDIFIESRGNPLCNVPHIGIGNKPIDGGNYLFTEEEKEEFIIKEPQSAKLFRPWIGSDEFINGYVRYCLWLGDCTPAELRQMPEVMKRVEAVKQFRLASKSEPTRKIADTPRRFHVENMPKSEYIVVPEVSSERRRYIPIGFVTPDVLSSNLLKIIPNATLYHFGILTSNVHMAWVRAVCGRLKSDYRYSKDIVYNNFPWPDASDAQRGVVEKLAQSILDARALFPDSSLADLYDPISMPPELLKAHQNLDRAVKKLYGFSINDTDETSWVAALMERYQDYIESKSA